LAVANRIASSITTSHFPSFHLAGIYAGWLLWGDKPPSYYPANIQRRARDQSQDSKGARTDMPEKLLALATEVIE